jgi:hypothetical protein
MEFLERTGREDDLGFIVYLTSNLYFIAGAGTPKYFSPEIRLNQVMYSKEADMW